MNREINYTHDPNLRSWIESANQKDTDFPIQNLPFGVFQHRNKTETPRLGVAIGDRILDLFACQQVGLFQELPKTLQEACLESHLNPLMALGSWASWALRDRLSELLRQNESQPPLETKILIPMSEAELLLPATIGDYTDFYASIFHATNVGKLFRPDNPLMPNYKYVPVGYHGRSSSIVVSGTTIKRPQGQRKSSQDSVPTFGYSQLLDYELSFVTVRYKNKNLILNKLQHNNLRVFFYYLFDPVLWRSPKHWELTNPNGNKDSRKGFTKVNPKVTKEGLEARDFQDVYESLDFLYRAFVLEDCIYDLVYVAIKLSNIDIA